MWSNNQARGGARGQGAVWGWQGETETRGKEARDGELREVRGLEEQKRGEQDGNGEV